MIKTQLMSMVAATIIGGNVASAAPAPYTFNSAIVNNQQPKQEIITQPTSNEQTISLEPLSYRQLMDQVNKKIAEETAKKKAEIERIEKSNERKNNVQFDSSNVLIKSHITKQELNEVFDKIGQPQMKVITDACVDAEKEYGVNALFLAAIVAQESGWTRKPAGDGTNLTGYAVYTNTSKGTVFHSYYGNVMATAKLLKTKYLTPGSKIFNGYSTEAVNTEYCKEQDQKTTKWSWHIAINHIGNDLENTYQTKVKHLDKVPEI